MADALFELYDGTALEWVLDGDEVRVENLAPFRAPNRSGASGPARSVYPRVVVQTPYGT